MFKNFTTMYTTIFSKTRMSFGQGESEQKLARIFTFLGSLAGPLATLTALWAISAGISQSGRLTEHSMAMFAHSSPVWLHIANWGGPIVGVVTYALRAFAVAMLICFAAVCVGGILGFLFGVPQPNRQETASSSWQVNTNLSEISGWLTKIIIGVGLVEIKSIISDAASFSRYVGSELFGGLAAARLVLPALMLVGVILGFILAFLITQLVLAPLISEVVLSSLHASSAVLSPIPPDSLVLAPNPVRASVAGPAPEAGSTAAVEKPSALELQAALNIQSLPLDRIDEPAMIKVWARAQAVLNQYVAASSGYTKLLEKIRTPEVLVEAARVFFANEDKPMARRLLDEAAARRNDAPAEMRASITFDAANRALYDPPPGGFNRALDLLDDETLKTDDQGKLHVLRACANGQRFKFRAAELTDNARNLLLQSIIADLKHSLTVNKAQLEWVRYLIDPAFSARRLAAMPPDDDLDNVVNSEQVKVILAVAAQ
jgi:hypothetical protein